MKPFGNQPAYSSFTNTTKPYILLLPGAIALFLFVCIMQLIAHFNTKATSLPAEITQTTTVAKGSNNKKPEVLINHSVVKDFSANVIIRNKRKNPQRILSTPLSKKEEIFFKQNKKTTDSVIRYLGGITEMQEFHFKKNSFQLEKQNGLEKLDSVVQQCLHAPETWSRIVLLGFTDNRGSRYENIKLGLKRALNLKNKLVSKGIPADKIAIASFGEDLAIENNNTPRGRYLNRRVEFSLIGNN